MKTQLLTTGQVAKILHCSHSQVVRLCDAGKLPHRRVGTHRRFERAVIEWYAEEHGIPRLARPFVLLVAAFERYEPFLEAATAARSDMRWAEGSPLQIAHLAGSDPPDAVLIGCDNGLGIAASLTAILLATPNPPAVAIVLAADGDPHDPRLGAVRSRLKWLGMEPASWDGVLVQLGLLPRDRNGGRVEGPTHGEPGGVLASG